MWQYSHEEAKELPLSPALGEDSDLWQQGGQHLRLTQDEARLTTGRAAVWPLSRVPHTVLHQLPLHVEGLPTLITGKHLVSCVRLFVLFQIAEIAEP